MKNVLIITLVILLTLISNYLGHINPPFSINWTPILVGLFTVSIMYFTDFRILVKFILITSLIIINDILIKLFAGGTHDWEGVGWITAFLLLGLLISLAIIVFYGFTKRKNKKKEFFLFLLGTCIILYSYLSYFGSFGMVWVSSPSENIELAKENGLFVSDIEISDSIIMTNQNEKFLIKKGWVEKQIKFNHKSIFKHTEKTDKFYCTLLIEGNFADLNYNKSIYYKLKENDSRGFSFMEKEITMTFEKSQSNHHVIFYNKDYEIIKEIEIKNKIQRFGSVQN